MAEVYGDLARHDRLVGQDLARRRQHRLPDPLDASARSRHHQRRGGASVVVLISAIRSFTVLRYFGTVSGLFVCANCWSSSPLRTAVIRMSMTKGTLSSDGTAIAFLPATCLSPCWKSKQHST